MTTKQEIAEMALSLIKVHSQYSRATPEDVKEAVSALDFMLSAFGAEGINLSYNVGNSSNPEIGQESGLPIWAIEPVSYNLAIRLAPKFGVAISPQINITASDGKRLLYAKTVNVPKLKITEFTTVGAGYKLPEYGGNQFVPLQQETTGIVTPSNQELDL